MLWRHKISEKYGIESNGWDVIQSRLSYGVGVWKGITNLKPIYHEGLKCIVGTGNRVKFWFDHWIGDQPLMKSHPGIYSASRRRNAYISEIMALGDDGALSWNLDFNPRRYNEDSEEAISLSLLLGSFVISTEEDNRI
ncbi:hypothetical protein BVC80_929g8 [Macleaya cordata]|uniref:Reverse transcriptase zinc-binding domain n=1 Tax=Macleaya cordata TaxID=56857 RepID=A0A200Q190_MACCD|nr:hypothetical protein BVC80_929g8 [Macleaya cordata]